MKNAPGSVTEAIPRVARSSSSQGVMVAGRVAFASVRVVLWLGLGGTVVAVWGCWVCCGTHGIVGCALFV